MTARHQVWLSMSQDLSLGSQVETNGLCGLAVPHPWPGLSSLVSNEHMEKKFSPWPRSSHVPGSCVSAGVFPKSSKTWMCHTARSSQFTRAPFSWACEPQVSPISSQKTLGREWQPSCTKDRRCFCSDLEERKSTLKQEVLEAVTEPWV